jgi:hypothetical protein
MSVLRGGGGVDLLEHAQAAGVFVLQAGLLGAAGGAEGAEECGGPGGVVCPDLAVAGVVGGLRAARRIAQPGQRQYWTLTSGLARCGATGPVTARSA